MKDNNIPKLSNEELEFFKSIDVEVSDTDTSNNFIGIENYKTYENLTEEQFETMKDKMRKRIEGSIKFYEDNSGTFLTNDTKEEQWKPMDEEAISDFASQFLIYENDTIDLSKFDYEIHSEQYYRDKFPGFPDTWFPIMAEASRTKIDDKRTPTFSKINKPTTLSFS